MHELHLGIYAIRFITISILLLTSEIPTAMITLLLPPIVLHRLTKLFYKYNEKSGIHIAFDLFQESNLTSDIHRIKRRAFVLVSCIVITTIIFNTYISHALSTNFDEIFHAY